MCSSHIFFLYGERFILVDVGDMGCHNDAGVLSNSKYGQSLEENVLNIPEPCAVNGHFNIVQHHNLITVIFLLQETQIWCCHM